MRKLKGLLAALVFCGLVAVLTAAASEPSAAQSQGKAVKAKKPAHSATVTPAKAKKTTTTKAVSRTKSTKKPAIQKSRAKVGSKAKAFGKQAKRMGKSMRQSKSGPKTKFKQSESISAFKPL